MCEKKRNRPTFGQVRELENKVSELKEHVRILEKANGYSAGEVQELMSYKRKFEEQLEGTSVIVADCNAWREKYRELKAKFDEQVEGTSRLVADCNAWREKYRKLAKENDELNCRHQKLKIDADNAEYELNRSVTASAYNALKEKYDDIVEESASMSAELRILREQRDDVIPKSSYEELKSKNANLESSNKYMEEELERVRIANRSLNELNDERLAQIQQLKSRGFWARVFNK